MSTTTYEVMIHSAVATGIAEVITLPICTIKTNYQVSNAQQQLSIVGTASQIYRTGGVAAFYRASLPAIGGQMFSTSSKWTLYQYLQKRYPATTETKNQTRIVHGLVSGVITTLFTHPIDFTRVHLQMGKSIPSMRYAFRGYSKTLSKIAVGSCCFFPLNDYFKDVLQSHNELSSNQQAIGASALSAFASTLLMHPIDYLKTRHIAGEKLHVLQCYRGLTLNLLRIVPHFTITMSCIDYFTRTWQM